MLYQFFAFSFLVAGLPTGHMPDESSPSLKGRLQQEAPQAWQKYLALAKKLQGSSTGITHHQSPKGCKDKKQYFEFKQREGCVMSLTQTTESQNLAVQNPKYMFELHRAQKDNDWAVARVGASLFKATNSTSPAYFVNWVNRLPVTFGIMFGPLQFTLDDPGFSVLSVSSIEENGRELVQVVFDYFPKEDVEIRTLRAGTVWLDPQRLWTFSRFDARMDMGGRIVTAVCQFQYKEGSGKFPILERTTQRMKDPAQDYDAVMIDEFDLKEADPAESEFRLSAFGFPEPKGVVWEEPSRWYLWFIGLALCAAATGWYFQRRARRRKLEPA